MLLCVYKRKARMKHMNDCSIKSCWLSFFSVFTKTRTCFNFFYSSTRETVCAKRKKSQNKGIFQGFSNSSFHVLVVREMKSIKVCQGIATSNPLTYFINQAAILYLQFHLEVEDNSRVALMLFYTSISIPVERVSGDFFWNHCVRFHIH